MRKLALAAPLALVLAASPAFAGVNVTVYGGQRNATLTAPESTDPTDPAEDTKYKGNEVGFSIAAGGRLPIAFGLFAQMGNATAEEQDGSIFKETWKTTVAGPEISVWAPLGFFQPYLKVSYIAYGTFEATTKTTEDLTGTPFAGLDRFELEGKVGGYHGTAGLRFAIGPYFRVAAEYDMGFDSVTAEKGRFVFRNGVSVDAEAEDAKAQDLKSSAVRLALGVSF